MSTERISRRRYLKYVGAGAVALAAAGIGYYAYEESLPKGPKEVHILQVSDYTEEVGGPFWKWLYEEFQRETGIKAVLDVMPWPGTEKVAAFLASGASTYDVIYGDKTALSFANYLLPLNKYPTDELRSDMPPKAFVTDQGGNIVGVHPGAAVTRIYAYNKELFRKAGITPKVDPTWEEIRDWATKMTQGSQYGLLFWFKDRGIVDGFYRWLGAAGGDLFDRRTLELTIDTPQAVKALTFLRSLVTSGCLDPASFTSGGYDVAVTFSQGNTGIIDNFSYNEATFKDPAKSKIANNYGWMELPIPAEGGRHFDLIGGDTYMIPKTSKHPDWGWEFINFWVSKQIQLQIAVQTGWMPVRLSTYDEPTYLASSESVAVLKQEAQGTVDDWTHPRSNDIYPVMTDQLNFALRGEKTPEQALTDAANALK